MERIIDRLMSREALSMTLSEIERLVGAEGRELMQAHVDLRAAQEHVVEVVGADGVARTPSPSAAPRHNPYVGGAAAQATVRE